MRESRKAEENGGTRREGRGKAGCRNVYNVKKEEREKKGKGEEDANVYDISRRSAKKKGKGKEVDYIVTMELL